MTDPPANESVNAESVVRSGGFDPAQLTRAECEELADILAWDETPQLAASTR